MPRILYLFPGHAPPALKPEASRFSCLSGKISGDIVQPIWRDETLAGKSRVSVGDFTYHFTVSMNLPRVLRTLWEIFFYVYKGVSIFYFRQKYDLVISYGSNKTGIAAVLIKILTRRCLILEVPGNPAKAFEYDTPEASKSFFAKIKQKISDFSLSFVGRACDRFKLLYPNQLASYPSLSKVPVSVFHDFVPVSRLATGSRDEKFLLFLGYPWYLKGVDVLIQAFKKISAEYPEYSLKIVGYCPEPEYFESLAGDCKQIELSQGVSQQEAFDLMSRCSAFVLPSRTEAMGRVLLEAMAIGKPIVASRVDGIPHYIIEGYNGLLFEPESVDDLAKTIESFLSNAGIAKKLSANAREYVLENFTEKVYTQEFLSMIDKVLDKENR